ncbi:MAG: hypothetical protein E7289_06490 [Lachnospiraceae bacterium]|nr:hypothetical protein [Lachnospiraceae bacterium]
MDLAFPLALYLGIPAAIVLLFFRKKKKQEFVEGNKVANAGFLEGTEYYKKLRRKYKVFRMMALVGLWLSIIAGIVLLARPAKMQTIHPQLHNRDIFLCIDVSNSVDELNLDICRELKKVVKELDGERFGITIFNGQAALLVPLTNDYDYVLKSLDKLEMSFRNSLGEIPEELAYVDGEKITYYYKHMGTLSDYGSSFIGDGLASCLYNFPDLKENDERSRLIIFTTDNELNGTPFVTLDEATSLCAKNDVRVYGVVPENVADGAAFKSAVESTGGGYYQVTSTKVFDKLLEDIRLTDTSVMEDVKTLVIDKPQAAFICMLVFMGVYFICSRKVRL